MLKDMRLSLSAIAAAVLAFLVLLPFGVLAQTPDSPPASSQESLKPQELEALVAPIALYPDTLLAEVMMAATYPLELVQADRWLTANKRLRFFADCCCEKGAPSGQLEVKTHCIYRPLHGRRAEHSLSGSPERQL